MRRRCSIAWCPWRAKYSFSIDGYYECWLHGGQFPWFNLIYDLFTLPLHYFYRWMKYCIALKWQHRMGFSIFESYIATVKEFLDDLKEA